MRAFSVACLIVVLAARAEAQRVEYMHVAVPGYQRVVKLDTAVIWTRVDTPAPETYHALRLALEELKIPVVLADSAHFFIYNATVRMSRRISGEDMTWAFRCGQSPTGIDYATSARMTTPSWWTPCRKVSRASARPSWRVRNRWTARPGPHCPARRRAHSSSDSSRSLDWFR